MKTFYHLQDLPCFVSLHFASRLIYIPATEATFLRVNSLGFLSGAKRSRQPESERRRKGRGKESTNESSQRAMAGPGLSFVSGRAAVIGDLGERGGRGPW